MPIKTASFMLIRPVKGDSGPEGAECVAAPVLALLASFTGSLTRGRKEVIS